MTSINASIIVQINYTFDMDAESYQQAAEPFAATLADVPGLLWKIWMIDRENCQAGGIYHFEDVDSALTYLEGPILSPFAKNPAFRDFSVKLFDILHEPTIVTRGPVRNSLDSPMSIL